MLLGWLVLHVCIFDLTRQVVVFWRLLMLIHAQYWTGVHSTGQAFHGCEQTWGAARALDPPKLGKVGGRREYRKSLAVIRQGGGNKGEHV